jgi:hypothetical protein
MAYGPRAFLKDLAIYSTGAAVGAKNSAKFVGYAAKQGIRLTGVGAARAVAAAPGIAAANPISAGIGLGLGALATPPGQDLLAAAAQRGASDRVRLQQAIDQYIFEQTVLPFREQQAMVGPTQSTIQVSDFGKGGRESRGGAPNQHNLAVKAGMKALKASKFDGPKGKLRKPKLSFSKVNKTISRIKKRAKVSKKGATGVIARAVKRYT